jgi:fructokinase
LVVTDGSRVTRWYTRNASGELPSFDVRAIDCTGAGDAFVGGLLHGLAARAIDAQSLDSFARDEHTPRDVLRYAAACGALAVTRVGSFAAMPARTEVERFLEERA